MPDLPAHNPEQKATMQARLGARLKEARETLGITQEDAATAVGIPRTAIVSMERGTRNVSATELSVMASLYRRSVPWLLGEPSDAPVDGNALFRATASLSEADKKQVLRFAQFLSSAGTPPSTDQAL
ncbi:XRE family transcriptional regulator [Brevibacterium aurantiacum]|uniref:XRE family transcriptional regulator n=2 Tax=Brevibacterium aurantiacum TaxID=273384 RepID=A0A4Z0KCZ5_BREAU|nr:XRE family transcriptional regulator [Brevibacterium aurantiacum]